MPALTRWYIKTSLVYFILALLAGILLAVQSVWKALLPNLSLFPVYFHLLAEGWLTFLILGVAFWMFPKYSKEKPRGSELLGWASYILINTGLLLRILSEPESAYNTSAGWLLVVSAVLQWTGGMAFVINTWSRVKEK